jgi:hypothetical protein
MLLRCGTGCYRAWIRQRSWAKSAIVKRAIGMCSDFKSSSTRRMPLDGFQLWNGPHLQAPCRANDLRTMCCKRARSLKSQSGRNPVTRILLPSRSIPAKTSSVVEVGPNTLVPDVAPNRVPMFCHPYYYVTGVELQASGAKTLRERSLQIRSSAPPSKSANSPV